VVQLKLVAHAASRFKRPILWFLRAKSYLGTQARTFGTCNLAHVVRTLPTYSSKPVAPFRFRLERDLETTEYR